MLSGSSAAASAPSSQSNNNNSKPAPAEGNRANLLQEIQQGTRLKKVGPPPERSPLSAAPTNTRDNMMMQIRQGAQLKHVSVNVQFPLLSVVQVDQAEVENHRKSVPGTQDLGGIAGALARALEERRKNMNNSDGEWPPKYSVFMPVQSRTVGTRTTASGRTTERAAAPPYCDILVSCGRVQSNVRRLRTTWSALPATELTVVHDTPFP